ncbi:MAG: hypothetical protein ACR2PF_06975 [Rhizobiaceae bacterium]
MFTRLKYWHRNATRYDCGTHTFFSAICIAVADAPVEACAACHIDHATMDMAFTKFHTILNIK